MNLPRRQFLRLVAAATALPAVWRVAYALDYPARPVHIVVGYAPGQSPDIIARIVSAWLSDRLGQQFLVDNKPGVAGTIAAASAAKTAPDGNTLLLVTSNDSVSATLRRNLGFNFASDFVPVGFIATTPFVMATNPEFPPKTVPEFIAYAKANPGKINVASPGLGSSPHLSGELFKMMTGVDFLQVPYRGNYLPDLLSGHVQLSFVPTAAASEFVKDGRLRALAVTTSMRSDLLPDVPSVAEFVPGYEAAGWYGICAPRGTPPEIISKLNVAIQAGLTDAKVARSLIGLGVRPRAMTPAEFGKFIAGEIEKWAKVIEFAGIKPE